jgi:hypothetical protein
MNQNLLSSDVSKVATHQQESEPVAVLHQQTKAEEAELYGVRQAVSVGIITDDELGELLRKTLREGMAANLSEFEASELFALRVKSLGVGRKQYFRVVDDFIAAQDYVERLCKVRREFAKDLIEKGLSFDEACQLLDRVHEEKKTPESKLIETKKYLGEVWESVKLEVEQERQLKEQAKAIAEAEQFKQLERVERRRQRRAQREADRLEVERIKQAELNTAAAKAAKEQRKAEAKRRAAELEERHRQKEEAKRQAWLAAHPKLIYANQN